jgi:hypothetical protein
MLLDMAHIKPVILCGGSGTRLWPMSRSGFPKQFLCLTGENSLFQQAAKRLKVLGNKAMRYRSPSSFATKTTAFWHPSNCVKWAFHLEAHCSSPWPATLPRPCVGHRLCVAALHLHSPGPSWCCQKARVR